MKKATTKKDVYQIITDQILEKLEKGVVPWSKPWTGAGGGMNKNLISKKPYSGINIFLLGFSGYDSPYWLTYKQAKAKGGHVRKGEKGTIICFWKTYGKQAPHPDPDADDETAIQQRYVLRYYRVFNLEQCEGIEPPDEDKPKEREFKPIEAAEKIVDEMPKRPEVKFKENRAYYVPSLDYVNMPKKERFVGDEEFYSTLFHELGHSTGHKSRLDRHAQEGADHMFGSKDYSKEELVAEMTATFLCGHAGIENKTIDNSASYIKSWVRKFKEQPKMVISAAGKAQKAADYILNVSK